MGKKIHESVVADGSVVADEGVVADESVVAGGHFHVHGRVVVCCYVHLSTSVLFHFHCGGILLL